MVATVTVLVLDTVDEYGGWQGSMDVAVESSRGLTNDEAREPDLGMFRTKFFATKRAEPNPVREARGVHRDTDLQYRTRHRVVSLRSPTNF